MNVRTISCPRCGASLSLDGAEFNSIASQVKDQMIDEAVSKAVQEKEREMTERQQSAVQTAQAQAELQNRKTVEAKNQQIASLQTEIEQIKRKANEFTLKQNAAFEKKSAESSSEIASLQKELSLAAQAQESAVTKAIAEEREKARQQKEQIAALQTQIQALKSQIALEVKNAICDHEKIEAELREKISAQEKSRIENETALNDKYEGIIKGKDEQIAYYKDFRAHENSKITGEDLEQHCQSEVDALRPLIPDMSWHKDNDVSPESKSKGDYILKDFVDGVEYISIMFEMKNESNIGSSKKHRNEDFFRELDKDRREKGCEYAVLVSMLEPDSELYNRGIVDVSYKYPKMFVCRPQFMVPLIMILRQAAMNTVDCKREIQRLRDENLDVSEFENNLNSYKDAIAKNCLLAQKNNGGAIKKIDSVIATLTQIKTSLQSMDRHMEAVQNKADKLTIKKLVKNAPTVAALIDDASEKESAPVTIECESDTSENSTESDESVA